MSKEGNVIKTSISFTESTSRKIEVLKKHFVRRTTSNLFVWLVERDYNKLSQEQIKKTQE
jgi:hypothetical protein